MEKLLILLKRNWIYLAGAMLGGVFGYLYWYFIGCVDGTCPITASPINSTIWGAVAGGLLFGLFKKETKNE